MPHVSVAQPHHTRIAEHPPEAQQPCAGWAEGQAEVLGPGRAEGAPWEVEEEAEVEEVLQEVRASSAASGQLQNSSRALKFIIISQHLKLQRKRQTER